MSFGNGIVSPPAVSISFDGGPSVNGHLYNIRLTAGGAPSTVSVGWPQDYAERIDSDLETVISVTLDGNVIFKGQIVEPQYEVGDQVDEVRAEACCDKWVMAGEVVGRHGVGTTSSEGESHGSKGFTDVGYSIVFNPGGRPNRGADHTDFSLASSASAWTVEDMIKFVFEHYIDSGLAALPTAFTGTGWTGTPADVDLTGMPVPQAIDLLCELAGVGWSLSYGAIGAASTFVEISPTQGTSRTVTLINPGAGASVTTANAYYTTRLSARETIGDARDVVQVFSAPIVKESTYTNVLDVSGLSNEPLLRGSTLSGDKEYQIRFSVDVTKYAANNLGQSRSAGAPAKPWLQRLVTRQDESTGEFLTAAQIAADSSLREWPTLEKPYVWFCQDATETERVWQLVSGGYRIDFENGFLDFKTEFELYGDSGEKEKITLTGDGSWTKFGILLTVATVLDEHVVAVTGEDDQYLSNHKYVRVDRNDLIPELRQNSILPDLTTDDMNDGFLWASEAEENYVDVAADLDASVASATAAQSAVEQRVRAEFSFFPEIAVGDRMSFSGRTSLALPTVMVDNISYHFHEGVPNSLICSGTTVIRKIGQDERDSGDE